MPVKNHFKPEVISNDQSRKIKNAKIFKGTLALAEAENHTPEPAHNMLTANGEHGS